MSFTEKLRHVVQTVTGTQKAEPPVKDVHEVILETPTHIEEGLKLGQKVILPDAINLQHLTFVGMGGSMHPAFLLKTYLENINCSKQINIVRDYVIPSFISKKGFLFVISYSGNTAETLEAYKQAYRQGYKMLVITSGGKLKEYAEKNGTPIIILPEGYQPRHTIYYMFGIIMQILLNSGIIEKQEKHLEEAIRILHKPIFEQMGKQIAEKLDNKMPIIYTTPKLGSVSQRWKICFNENSKVHAFYNEIPEMNHNELNGYATKQGNFHIIFVVDEEEAKHHRHRISATKQIIKEHGYTTTEVVIKGPSYLARLLSAVHIGDWTSYYTAQRLGVDPARVKIIEQLKEMVKD